MQVILANDGKQALDYFAQYQTQIDLIILDWVLPKFQYCVIFVEKARYRSSC